MKEQKNNNMRIKVLSVLIAVLIWLLVANINDPVRKEKFTGIPVTIINENALTDLGYAYEVVEGDQVSITVEGKNSVVGNMSATDFQAVADFSKLSEVDAVPIDVTAKKYANQLEITLGNVNTMKIKKDQVISVSVPVNIVLDGEVAGGYAVGTATGTPNLVKVTGPENLLSQAKEIRAEVDIDGVTHDVTTAAEPILYDKEGKEIKSSQIDMDTSLIEVSVEVWKTKMVGIQLESQGRPAAGYEMSSFDYEPNQVEVAAPDDVLDNLSVIDLGTVSVQGLKENYEKDLNLNEDLLPEGVILVDDDTEDVKIKATIEKRISRRLTFTSDAIRIQGIGKRKVTFDQANKYVIKIDGAESRIKNLKITDFSPWIDISDLEEGEHTVRIHVLDVDGATVSSTVQIKLTIS